MLFPPPIFLTGVPQGLGMKEWRKNPNQGCNSHIKAKKTFIYQKKGLKKLQKSNKHFYLGDIFYRTFVYSYGVWLKISFILNLLGHEVTLKQRHVYSVKALNVLKKIKMICVFFPIMHPYAIPVV